MNFKFYAEKLFSSQEFKNFKKEFPDAFLTSGFFSIDKEKEGQNQFHLDFYVPSVKKLFSFKLEKGIEKLPIDIIEGQEFGKLSDGHDFSFDELGGLIKKEMESRGIKNTIQKLIYSFQVAPLGVPQGKGGKDRKEVLFTTVFISGFGILKVNIDILEKKIISFEKKNFMDFLRVSPNRDDPKCGVLDLGKEK